jgi:hypothetical protein
MQKRSFLYLFGCLAISLVLIPASCTDDGVDKTRAILSGKWDLFKGFRNKKQTETLNGVYFEFSENGTMKSNLPIGPEDPIPFELNKNYILQKGAKSVRFDIKQISDSSLVLATEIRGTPFEFHLKRAILKPDTSTVKRPDSLITK